MVQPVQKRLENWSPMVAGEGVFSAEECAKIIALGGPLKEGQVFDSGGHSRYRNSRVTWIRPAPETEWVFQRSFDFVRQVNAQTYEMDLAGFTEPLQVAEYAEGQYYDWHLDLGGGRISIRKLSFIVQLTDPAAYEGGEVEVLYAREPEAMIKAQGAVITFPTYILHRVKAVTSGARHSLVGWIGGPHFR
jgi:PKHD-type hydroxylase